MIPDGYRVILAYDAERENFVARMPELGDLHASGATRAEALTGVEQELEKAFQKAAEAGVQLPKPIDASEFSGEIGLKLSQSLHRELVFEALQEKVEIEDLCAELLTGALAGRRVANHGNRASGQSRRGQEKSGRRGRRSRQGGKGYFNIMDDKASFMEYVRGLEGGGGGRRGGNRGRR